MKRKKLHIRMSFFINLTNSKFVWAQPIVDVISLVVGSGMYSKVSRKMMKQEN